jgi:DNA-binding FrmR family transcriptional regulator
MPAQEHLDKPDVVRAAQRSTAVAAAATVPGLTPGNASGRSGGAGRPGSTPDPEVLAAVAAEGSAEAGGVVNDLDPTFRHAYSRDQAILVRRLRRIGGQVRGIERMIERREYCIDILQQTAALRAAVDSVALLILEDHVQGCVRTAVEKGESDRYIEEVLDVVRRTLGKPVRNPRA